MKHTCTQSVKFIGLVRALRPHMQSAPVDVETIAVGILERLWHATITSAPRGDIGKIDDELIAELVGWYGDAVVLIEILTRTGWLDQCDVHRLIVHDWPDHAPRFVHGIVARKGGFARDYSSELQSATIVADYSPQQPNITKHNNTPPAPPIGGRDGFDFDLPPEHPHADSEEFQRRWAEWSEIRSKKRRKPSKTQVSASLETLAEMELSEAVRVLRATIEKAASSLVLRQVAQNGSKTRPITKSDVSLDQERLRASEAKIRNQAKQWKDDAEPEAVRELLSIYKCGSRRPDT